MYHFTNDISSFKTKHGTGNIHYTRRHLRPRKLLTTIKSKSSFSWVNLSIDLKIDKGILTTKIRVKLRDSKTMKPNTDETCTYQVYNQNLISPVKFSVESRESKTM